LAISSNKASSKVTYTSISSYLNGLSWGISLVNVGELTEIKPYEEVSQQGQVPPLSPAYVPGPMELEEHLLVYVPELEHPEYHAPSNDVIQVEDQPYADDASSTTDEEHELEDDDDDDDTDDEDEEPTKDEEEDEHIALADSSAVPVVDPVPSAGDIEAFKTDESAPTPGSPQIRILFSQTRLRRAQKTVRLEPPMSAFMEARIAEHAAAPIPPTSPAYDQAALGHRAAMIPKSSVAAARPPRGQYDFVNTAYLSSKAQNRALLARLATLETHMSRMEWQRQRVEDDAVRQIMRIRVLKARAQIDTVEDTDNSS
ncbi:hypothetical protein Tco_1451790, partial [Tanacetum coccineum]